MPITTITLSPTWGAGLFTDNYNGWEATQVYNPFTSDINLFAWDAQSGGFAHVIAFDYNKLRLATQQQPTATILLRVRFDGNSSGENFHMGYHTMSSPPQQYSPVSGIGYNGQEIYIDSPSTWQDLNVGFLRNAFASNATGITFLPYGYMEGLFEPSLILQGNWTPQRPTLQSPIGGIFKDRTKEIIFQWQHNGVFNQSAYELRYRKVGTTTWTTLSENKFGSSRTLPSNTLSTGEYEWQVRTTMTHNGQTATGDWSSTAVFVATDATNAPTITQPSAGSVVPISNLTVGWESVANQERFKIELYNGSTLERSQEVVTSSNSYTFTGNWLENNESYLLKIAVKSVGEVYSDWASVNFSVSYTVPAKPELILSARDDDSTITVYIDNPTPTGTQPNVTTQDLYRRTNNGSWELIARDLENDASFVDYYPASGQVYDYHVIVNGDNDTFVRSDNFSQSVKVKNTLLVLASNPTQSVRLKLNPSRSFSKNLDATTKRFNGRSKPIVEFGESSTNDMVHVYTINKNDLAKLEELFYSRATILYRDYRGRKYYAAITSLNVDDESIYYATTFDYYNIRLSLVEVDYSEVTL